MTAIVEYSQTEAALATLSEKYKGVLWDVTVPAEMKRAREARAELRTYRTSLERIRVEIKAPALERTRLIDAEARRITGALEALEKPIDEQIKLEEQRKEREKTAEAERIAGIHQAIADLNAVVPDMAGKSSADIQARIEALQTYEVAEWAAEFLPQAQKAHAGAMAALQQLAAGALAQEQAAAAEAARIAADRAELARLQQEASERARQERVLMEEGIKRRLEEDRKAREAIEAAERASRAIIEAQEREARMARERADREAREALEAENARLRAIREAEEEKLRSERAQLEKERLAKEEAERQERLAQQAREETERVRQQAIREADEAKQREIQRKKNERLDAHAMLITFCNRFGHIAEFAPVVKAINNISKKAA